MNLTKALYLLSELTESQLPQDCGKMYAATHGWLFDDPENPSAANLNPMKLVENIRFHNLKRKLPTAFIIDIEANVPWQQYADVMLAAMAELPSGWTIMPYVFPQQPASYWWEILNRTKTQWVYLPAQRNNDHPNGIGNKEPLAILSLLEWAKVQLLVPKDRILVGTEYWWTKNGEVIWRDPASLLGDVAEIVRNDCPVAIWNPQPRTPLMDDYRQAVLSTIREVKQLRIARKEMAA